MNAIAMTIKASQDAEAASKAAAEAKVEMQKEVFAEARRRVDSLVKDFNELPMELQSIGDGTSTGKRHPLYTGWGSGREYQMMGKGLRFFLIWAKDGRSLIVMLNCMGPHATHFCRKDVAGRYDMAHKQEIEAGQKLMTLKEAQQVVTETGSISHDNRQLHIVGHITLDGGFARGAVSYDDKENPERVYKTPVEWMTSIVGGHDLAPFVVVGTKRGKK